MYRLQRLSLILIFLAAIFDLAISYSEIPKFGNLMTNLTVTVGRDAVLACVVENLSTYKVAWLRVDTQTILTIQGHVITKNHRVGVSHSDNQVWRLHIKEAKNSDRGWYMCQINTDPMKSQTAYLEVVAPPDILDDPNSSDVIVSEGTNVSLRCETVGFPPPLVTWRREDGEKILTDHFPDRDFSIKSSSVAFTRVSSRHSGVYLCIASNGVPPTVSKRISLIVQHPPKIRIKNKLVGVHRGQKVTLECEIEAYPKPVLYWMSNDGHLLTEGSSYEVLLHNFVYKIQMRLTIELITEVDFGIYICVSKNSLGVAEGAIKVQSLKASWIWNPTGKPDKEDEDFNVEVVHILSVPDGAVNAGISTVKINWKSQLYFMTCIIIILTCRYINNV